jgi:hypothetical protein
VFHVFVEGATDGSPAGLDRLAAAMASHYGLPAAELRARLATGKFRVKGNVDRKTAEQYLRDLERLGARCKIEPAAAPQFQSGLAAAFSGQMPAANLGALEKPLGALSLASVDGSESQLAAPPETSFAPPPEAAEPVAPARPSKPKVTRPSAPVDQFAPPDSGDMAVELAHDEPQAAKRPSIPPPQRPVEPVATIAVPGAAPRPAGKGLGDERVQFALGVLVAIVLGFVPAHIVSSIREHSAYAAVDRELLAAQQLANSPETYAKLDAVRADHLDRKRDERRSIAVLAFVLWGVAGGGIAYAWFRKIPWERFAT